MAAPTPSLDDIRAEIDRLDDAIHDLLMRRVEVVRGIGKIKGGAAPKWLPAREAQLLRRLVARHHGAMPLGVLVRIWREMIVVGSLALQETVSVAVLSANGDAACWDLSRDHFGAVVPLQTHPSPGQVVREVADGSATIGVLPAPADGEAEPWWPLLVGSDAKAPRVVARLPFAGPGNGRARKTEALAIARVPFEPSGDDRSLLVVAAEPDLSRASMMAALRKAGVQARWVALSENDKVPAHLLEVEGFVGDADPRLAALKSHPRLRDARVIGGYAVPLPKT